MTAEIQSAVKMYKYSCEMKKKQVEMQTQLPLLTTLSKAGGKESFLLIKMTQCLGLYEGN